MHGSGDDLPGLPEGRSLLPGLGHGVVRPWWGNKSGNLLILSGDVPLISSKTLQRLIRTHNQKDSSVTLLTTNLTDPSGYG